VALREIQMKTSEMKVAPHEG